MSAEHTCNEADIPQRACAGCIEEHEARRRQAERGPLWHQARKAAETAFNLLPMPVQLQNFTREERERYVDAMGDVILMALEEAKHHGMRLSVLEIAKMQPIEFESDKRDYLYGTRREVWLAIREAVLALLL